jgi:polyisoprenyl-phosphate glycosyltransferase
MPKTISIIIPCHNEEKVLHAFFIELLKLCNTLPQYVFEIIAINDGSKDDTLDVLLHIKENLMPIKIIDFSRNFGKEAALTAGIDYATGDAIIPIDADLQHPPEFIKDMLCEYENGYDVVLAKRNNRQTDGKLQRHFANVFYKMHNKISDIIIPKDIGDFRLMDRKVIDAIKNLPENRRFMKGLFAWVGFKTKIIHYDVSARFAGKSSFNLWKLWNFALEGITSFSTFPLRMWTYIGLCTSFISIIYAIIVAITTFIYGNDVPGYTTIIFAILFLGGIQLIGIGVLGEYIGRIYSEVKNRPIYIVQKEY